MTPLALVTGGACRLGKAFALSLARQGYSVFLHYHQSEAEVVKTAETIRNLGVMVLTARADLTLVDEVQSLMSAVASAPSEFEFRLLVNSAAVMPSKEAHELPVKEWDTALDLNLRAPFLLSQEAAKKMTRGGLIVNVTDSGAQRAWSRFPAYVVSKAGLESLTRVLARSFAPDIRVNAIAPGLVLSSDAVPEEQWRKLVDRLPLKRTAKLEEITYALEFLIKNEYITGQTIVVDGGYSLV